MNEFTGTILASGFLLIYIVQVYNLVRCLETRQVFHIAVNTVLTLFTMFGFSQAQGHVLGGVLLPDTVIVICCALAFLLTALEFILVTRAIRIRLTPRRIKEAFDKLPMGICHYLDGGLPRMTNTTMNGVCESLTGEPMRNGEVFWERLLSHGFEGSVKEGTDPIVRLNDGRSFIFANTVIDTDYGKLHELTCSDVSEEMRLTHELEEKYEAEKAINIRLKNLMDTMEFVTMNKELYKLRSDLYDELGRGLFLAKCYVEKPSPELREEVKQVWEKAAATLKNDEAEKWLEPYYVIKKQASLMGVDLIVSGALPSDETLVPAVEAAIMGNITRAVSLQGQKTVRVSSTADGDSEVLLINIEGGDSEITESLEGELERAGGRAELIDGGMRVVFPGRS